MDRFQKDTNFAIGLYEKVLRIMNSKDKETNWVKLTEFIQAHSCEDIWEYKGICSSNPSLPGAYFPNYVLKDSSGNILEAPENIFCPPPCISRTFFLESEETSNIKLDEYLNHHVLVRGTWGFSLVLIGLPFSTVTCFKVELIEILE